MARITRERRHSFASLMIAAGVNAKALQTYMGHASVAITMTAARGAIDLDAELAV